MVGYITIAHGTAQRLSEKWRHVACTSVVIIFCTSPFCVGVVTQFGDDGDEFLGMISVDQLEGPWQGCCIIFGCSQFDHIKVDKHAYREKGCCFLFWVDPLDCDG